MKLLARKIIYGCEGRGDGDSPYLTRYTLIDCNLFKINIHVFHRSDHDVLHDHPWSFWTLILWRGYREHTPDKPPRRMWPLTLHYRPATWTHRVELIDGQKAVTLVFVSRYVRTWGFHTADGWVGWREYFKSLGC